ncbi:MAG: hypothetical protein F7C33_02640 [Desulfurococcales archaeon]|nr:hypothetical protein [Desulfurococcales archaeon]
MARRRRREEKEWWEYYSPRPEEYEVVGRPGKLVEKPSHLYLRGGFARFRRVERICTNFGVYRGFPPRNALEKMLGEMLVLVPAEYVLPGSGSRFWLVRLVFTKAPVNWRYRIPARRVEPCYTGGEWILRLCITDKEAWLLARSARSLAHCVEPLIAHAKIYAGAELLDKRLQLVAPLQVLKRSVKDYRLVYEKPYPWYYKIEKQG